MSKIKEEVLKIMEKEEIEVSDKYGFTDSDVVSIVYELEVSGIVQFSIVEACLGRDDYCSMAWYHSDKLGKIIVLDNDVGNFDDVDELVSVIERLEEERKDIEEEITFY